MTTNLIRAALIAALAAGPCSTAMAIDHSNHAAHSAATSAAQATPPSTGDAVTDISAKLKAMFETPQHALAVAPVVVSGDWAIAGWSQDDRGGRALLKRKGDGWSIHLCSGDSLKQAEALQQIGLPTADAQALATAVGVAEKHLDAALLARFASFEGTVMVEGADDAHAAGHQHQHKP